MKINLAPHHHPDRDMFYFVLSRMRMMITEEEKKKAITLWTVNSCLTKKGH